MATRIYVVTEAETGKTRLVEADSNVQATFHAAKGVFSVEVANSKAVATAMTAGAKIEVAEKLRQRSEKVSD